MFKNKRDLFNIGLLVIFVWLLITSYGSSKRKPENIGELTSLKTLRLLGNEISSKEQKRIEKALPNCKVYFTQ